MDKTRKYGQIKQGLTADTWFFPIGSKFNNSPPLSLENHALFIMVVVSIAGWVHLIKDAYLHDDKLDMYAACPYIPSVTIST